jgi:hypothetical protein
MMPILAVESRKNQLAKHKANFTYQLQVTTNIQTFNVEISKKISVTPNYNQLRNVLTIQDLKQEIHFRPPYRFAHFRLRHIQPKMINHTSFRSGKTGGKTSNDYDTHSTLYKLLVYKRGKRPFTGSETEPDVPSTIRTGASRHPHCNR